MSLFRCSSVSGPHISQLGYLCGAKKATGWYNRNFLNEKKTEIENKCADKRNNIFSHGGFFLSI
jgi:hypothetical protein